MNARRCLALPALLSALLLGLAGCPNDGDELSSTSATESSATEGDSDGDPSTSSPSTSTTEDPDFPEPTSPSTTAADDTTTTTGDPDDATTTTTTEDSSATDATDGGTTTMGDTTGGASECGNGIEEDGEECDKGEDNADGDYGGCNLDCTKQPYCGDGKHQPELGEICDRTADELVEAAVCTDACTWSGVIAFVTSQSYLGSLDGTEGADSICVAHAEAAGLLNPDGYRAWISVSNDNADSRIPKVNDSYYRLDGKEIALSSDQLFSGKLLRPLNVDENKAVKTTKVWTNTTPAGLAASEDADCQSFSSMSGKVMGIVGQTDKTDAGWTQQDDAVTCILSWNLYCFSEAF
jgi:hypothetical protein